MIFGKIRIGEEVMYKGKRCIVDSNVVSEYLIFANKVEHHWVTRFEISRAKPEPSAQEYKPPKVPAERSAIFCPKEPIAVKKPIMVNVEVEYDFYVTISSKLIELKAGEEYRAYLSNKGYWLANIRGNEVIFSDESFESCFTVISQIEEDTKMEINEEQAKKLAEREARLAEREAEIKELRKQFEEKRKQAVADEYGIVAERYLWRVDFMAVARWTGRSYAQTTEVVTVNKSMAEAAIAAEAIAKGQSDESFVTCIKYDREVGAMK